MTSTKDVIPRDPVTGEIDEPEPKATAAQPLGLESHDGWQLVPKVLSSDMIRAAINAWIAQGRKPGDIWGSEIGDMWRAMLAAAPARNDG